MNNNPVILINGFLAPKQANLSLKCYLSLKGFNVHLLDLPFLNLADIEKIAKKISEGVDKILIQQNKEKCDIIGVSLGGITGLYYLKYLEGNKKTDKFIAYGTPLKGTWKALLLSPFIGIISKSLWQTLPSNPILNELANDPIKETKVYSIYAKNDPIATPDSAKLDWTHNIEVKSFPFPISHQGLIFSKKAMHSIVDVLLEQ